MSARKFGKIFSDLDQVCFLCILMRSIKIYSMFGLHHPQILRKLREIAENGKKSY